VLGQRDRVPRKPDPAGALEIAEQLAVPVERCIFLGDTAVDIRTAVAAGMYPVGALWGFRPRDELVLSGARALVREPTELLAVIGRG
jgi:phosphoglycolate phosphatase